MKKFFRVALVCALAGATLLYTGCTKDYSEDLSSLEKKVEANEGAISTLKGQVAALESARTQLQGLIDEANKTISDLKGQLSTLEGKVKTAQGDISTIQSQITTINGQISDLQKRVKAAEDAIVRIDGELAKKADKTYVDTELAKKADKTWVEQTLSNYVLVTEFTNAIQGINAALSTLNQGVATCKDSLRILDVKIEGVQEGLTQAKIDIKKAQAAADSAQATADKALGLAQEVKEALNLYAKKTWVEAQLELLRRDYNTKLAAKVDTATYSAKMKEIDAKFVEIDSAIVRVIRSYKEADAILDAKIDTLAAKTQAALELKLDKTTFQAYVAEMEAKLKAITTNVSMLLSRVQSLVYVPEYDDNRITFNWALVQPEEKAAPAEGGNVTGNAVDAPSANLNDETKGDSPVIVVPSEVKYRIYGEDAADVVMSLVDLVNAKDSAILAFDVVRVKTRINNDGVAVKILGAAQDDLNHDIITLTVKPEGLPDAFWFSTWELGGYWNASKRQEASTDLPAFSMSLVLTDVGNDSIPQSRFITSTYENCVPAPAEIIAPTIVDGDADITFNEYADTVKIPYIKVKEDTAVLGDHALKFKFQDSLYTAEELAEMNINLPEITVSIADTPDYEKAIDPTKVEDLDPEYILITKDSTVIPGKADAQLTKLEPYGVGAENHVVFTYHVGTLADVFAGALVKVVPVHVDLVVDIWEYSNKTPFTWKYEKDAEVDAAILKGEAKELYKRDSAWADDAAAIEELKKYEVKPEDFARKVPVDTATFIEFVYKNGSVRYRLDSLKLETPAFNIAPFFDSSNKNELMAAVTNFNFCVDSLGSLTQINYDAIYNLPNDTERFLEIEVTGKIVVKDRDRAPIIVKLPITQEPYVVDWKDIVKDTLNKAKAVRNDQIHFENGDYSAHSLTDANLIDAYGKELAGKQNVLIMTVDGKEVRDSAATVRIITTVAEDVDNHVLDYNTDADINVSWAAGKVIEPYQKFEALDTLWYGQVVIVKKWIRFEVDGIYEFERIPEYVAKTDDLNYYTTLQPWWQPDGATVDFKIPVESYDAHKVLLNQHFRIVDVLKSTKENKVVCTEVETTDNVQAGDLTADYKDILSRVFKLEEPGHVGEQVDSIPDPRNLKEVVVPAATGVVIDTNNVVSYYSESPEEDAVGNLYVVNKNGSKVAMTTNFNRGNAAPSPRLAEAGIVVEHYENYVIKLFDPINEFTIKGEQPTKINVNNSIITQTSIFEFLSLKDKRNFELIDAKTENGWVVGNDKNGFAKNVKANDVYSLIFTNQMKYADENWKPAETQAEIDALVSPETQARIKFDVATGKLTYDNTLQTQLAKPINIILAINVEYPWGTRAKEVQVQFYNKPVGE